MSDFDATVAACTATFATMTPHQRTVSRALVDAFGATVKKLRAEADLLRAEADLAEMARSFHELTAKERDLERHSVNRLTAEVEELRELIELHECEGSQVGCSRCGMSGVVIECGDCGARKG